MFYLRDVPAPMTPIKYLSGSILCFCIAVSTPQKTRWLPQLPLLALAYLSFSTSTHWPTPIDHLWGMMAMVWIAHSTYLLWAVKWQAWQDAGQPCTVQTRLCACTQHRRIWRLWNNPRMIGTPSSVIRTQSSPLSRLRFGVNRLAKIIVNFVLYRYVQPAIFPGAFLPISLNEFDAEYQNLFRRLIGPSAGPPMTARETGMRSVWAILWAWGAYSVIDTAHSLFSILCVFILRIDNPNEWPSIFGSPRHAYGIRRFWGRSWHKLVVCPYTEAAQLFARNFLGLRPASLREKICVVFVIFGLSGSAHAIVSYRLNDGCGWAEDIFWFLCNAAAGLFESMVVYLLRRLAYRSGHLKLWDRFARSLGCKILGYVWVFWFFWWTVPSWQYPKIRCAIEKEVASQN